MPYAEHSCRLRPPGDFQDDSFRRIKRKHNGKEYSVIVGKLKGESSTTEQAYRYDKDLWDASEARSHCEDHGGTFEAALEDLAKERLDRKMLNKCFFKTRPGTGTYRNEATGPDEVTIYMYDEIGFGGINKEDFARDVAGAGGKTIHLRINSPGGSVFDGISMFNALEQYDGKIIAHVDGLAASIASVIAMAADEVHGSETSYFMIHDPWGVAIGNADAMQAEADLLRKIGSTISLTYERKTGMPKETIEKMMADETWFDGNEAFTAGFFDTLEVLKKEEKDMVDTGIYDLSVFHRTPDGLNKKANPTERDLERALRNAGLSQREAKEVLVRGYSSVKRDVDGVKTKQGAAGQRDADEPERRDAAVGTDKVAELLKRANAIIPNEDKIQELLRRE